MRRLSVLTVACVLFAASFNASAQAPPVASEPFRGSCAPVNGLNFVCGFLKPEDMVLVPGTRWLLTSGVTVGGGVRLIDTQAKTAKTLYTGGPIRMNEDKAQFPHCPGPPAAASFNAHGVALRADRAPGTFKLYVVSHGALESVQIFTVDARAPEPELTWAGCAPMPSGLRGNAVAVFGDGEILVTVQTGLGAPGANMYLGAITGAVFSRKPGAAQFSQIAGTELSGPNGLEVSPNDQEFYVATSGDQSVRVYSRRDASKPLRQVRAPFFNIDNLRWTDGHLVAVGMTFDEPACGGTRQQIAERGANPAACIRGYGAGELNPETLQWRVMAYGEPNPVFGGASTAVQVGDTLWISSTSVDRVAYRPVPGAP